ncbi:AAA family ATPase [Spirosoma oryzicola]|uniref:AAA family ATPase n=1 Tax=Spirosoma oryzicola TaxID=2898794 RepID=UPI001E4908CD|nr:AAA family ATPase [Spirosoma oryzicola]UHG94671.1 AAA family ATPase [Spirosoma oryzicola]
MFLKRIHIQHLRGIDDLEMAFDEIGNNRKQTLVLGENGVGKTNLLRAIALVTAGSDAINELIDTPDDWISFTKSTAQLEATLVTQEGQERNIKLVINRGDTAKDIILNNLNHLDEIDRALNHATRNYFVVGYGPLRRLNRGTFNRGAEFGFKQQRASNVASLFNQEYLLNPLTIWAMEVDYRTDGKGLDIIRESLNDFLPTIKFHSIDKEKGQLIFRQGNEFVPLHLLSDGYQNMVAWLGDLFYRISNTFNDYQSPLKARGLLLIDEIDLHLHPNWQRKVFDFIRYKLPYFQLIATTHSPLLAQQARQGELYSLKQVADQRIVLEAFRGAPDRLLLHQLLMSPAFDVDSDESLAVEQLKKDYETLRNRKETPPQELHELAEQINQLPQTQRSNMVYEPDQIDLLRDIQAELKARKGE